MKDIFLNQELKKYYMDDFIKNVLTCTHEFWEISEGLRDILIALNENSKIQSLYSHKPKFDGWDMKSSYIDIAFTQDIELTIFRDIIPYFQTCYNKDSDNRFNYFYSYPKIKDNVKEKKDTNNLASLIDKDYWKINRIRFEMNTNSKDIDDNFWRDVQTKLSELK